MWRRVAQGWAKIGCWAPASMREAELSCRAAMQAHVLVQTHPTVPASTSPGTALHHHCPKAPTVWLSPLGTAMPALAHRFLLAWTP